MSNPVFIYLLHENLYISIYPFRKSSFPSPVSFYILQKRLGDEGGRRQSILRDGIDQEGFFFPCGEISTGA